MFQKMWLPTMIYQNMDTNDAWIQEHLRNKKNINTLYRRELQWALKLQLLQ
jgi:hypothetical protein